MSLAGKSTLTIAAAVIVGIGAIAGVVYTLTKTKSKNGKEPALTEEGTNLIMTKILDKMKLNAARMVRAAENVQQQIAAQGQQIDDRKLMQMFILPHVDKEFTELQTHILDEYDADEEELEEAVEYYIQRGNKALKEIRKRIKLIYHELGGDVEIGEDASSHTGGHTGAGDDDDDGGGDGVDVVSLPDLVGLLVKLHEKIMLSVDGYIYQFLTTYGHPVEDKRLADAFEQGMLSLSEQAEKMVLKDAGLALEDFHKAMAAHQESKTLQRLIMKMQSENSARMQAHGIAL